MSVGEALVYGLLGGTAAAADHYVTDWRERTSQARKLAADKEGWKYQENLKLETAKKLADYERQNRDKSTQLALSPDGKQLIPIKPDHKTGAMPVPVAEITDGKVNYHNMGKGLLGGSGKGGSGSSGPKSVKSGIGMQLAEGSIEVDPETGERFQYVVNPQTNLWERVPVATRAEAPTVVTPDQVKAAQTFAEKTLDDMSGYFSTDATDFAPWGGSREAAKEYFTQNYLNGTLFDQSGNLIIPGQEKEQAPSPTPTTNETVGTGAQDAEAASSALYQSFTPQKQQHVQKFLKAMDDGRDPQALIKRMIELGFTEQELQTLFPGYQ